VSGNATEHFEPARVRRNEDSRLGCRLTLSGKRPATSITIASRRD
jgi:hypothetical protein